MFLGEARRAKMRRETGETRRSGKSKHKHNQQGPYPSSSSSSSSSGKSHRGGSGISTASTTSTSEDYCSPDSSPHGSGISAYEGSGPFCAIDEFLPAASSAMATATRPPPADTRTLARSGGMAARAPIYLDYNATTPISREVADVMRPFLDHFFGNPSR
jgi:hypothetical protein